MAAIGRLSKSHRRAKSRVSGVRGSLGGRGDPSLKRGKEAEGEKNPLSTTASPLSFLFPLEEASGLAAPNRWANFFTAQFNEASLNSLPGAADRSRGTDGGRAAEGSLGVGRDEETARERRREREGGRPPHRRRFVNRPLATLQCGRKVRESRFHWPVRSRPCA